MTPSLRTALVATVLIAVAPKAHAEQSECRVAVRAPECGEGWSEARFLDVLRIELQPFAELVSEGEQSSILLVLSGNCETQLIARIEGWPGERVVNLEDFAGSRERAVAMASARLVELWLSIPAPPVDVAGQALTSAEPEDPSPAFGAVQEGATGLSDPSLWTPARADVAEVIDEDEDATVEAQERELSAPQAASSPPLSKPQRQLAAGPTLLWLPVGGVSFGLDLDFALPFRGPLFFVLGTGFAHSRRMFDEGVLRLVRLEATAGAGLLWQRARFGIEGRLLTRVGWVRLGGESTGSTGETQDALSVGLQLDAGIVLQLGRIGFVLRGGPLVVLSGLEAADPSVDPPRIYVSFSGVSVVASLAVRVTL